MPRGRTDDEPRDRPGWRRKPGWDTGSRGSTSGKRDPGEMGAGKVPPPDPGVRLVILDEELFTAARGASENAGGEPVPAVRPRPVPAAPEGAPRPRSTSRA